MPTAFAVREGVPSFRNEFLCGASWEVEARLLPLDTPASVPFGTTVTLAYEAEADEMLNLIRS